MREVNIGAAPERGSTMVRMTTMSSPFLIGLDEIVRPLERAPKTGSDGYPPYNIERLPAEGNTPERLRITLAVAGFAREDIEVTQEETQRWMRGRQREDKSRDYIHRGIAARQFQRNFLLAEGMQVLGADLANGLLSIDVARPEPARGARSIEIASP